MFYSFILILLMFVTPCFFSKSLSSLRRTVLYPGTVCAKAFQLSPFLSFVVYLILTHNKSQMLAITLHNCNKTCIRFNNLKNACFIIPQNYETHLILSNIISPFIDYSVC